MGKFCQAILSFYLCAFAFSTLVKSVPVENEIHDEGPLAGIATKELPKKVTSFSLHLLKKLVPEKQGENLLFSPISAYAALMMLHLGAGEKTRKELNRVLEIPNENVDYEKLHAAFSELLKKVDHEASDPENSTSETIIANGFFVQKDRPIHDAFLESLRKNYNANATNVDFLGHPGEATDAINAFIAKSTKNRLPKFYESPLPASTVSVLSSALYFHGVWQNPFNEEHTKVEKFHIGNTEIDVHMMNDQKVLSHSYSDRLQADFIELPYKSGEYSMCILLPRASQTVENITKYIEPQDALELNRNSKVVGVDYKIPRMKFSWKKSLVDPLELAGVFASADLSVMSTDKVPISDMIQATEIEVNEHGTIATAATVISISRRLTPPVATPVKFYVDRPFLMSIFHKPTHMTVFLGIVNKPQQ